MEAGVSESWHIVDRAGIARRLQLTLRYRTPLGLTTDTVLTAVLCWPA